MLRNSCMRNSLHALLTVWTLTMFSAASLLAQEEEDAPPAPEGEPTIYVPYRNLDSVFNRLGASAIVPYSEWLQMWQAHRGGAGDDEHPVQAVITRADYTATIEKDLARIQAVLTVNVLGDPWVEIPVRFGEAAVGSLNSDDENVLLRGTGDGTYSLLLGKSGEQTVTLELVARVHTSPDGREFTFDTPTVGITTLEVVIPEDDQTVSITPRLVSLPADDGGDEAEQPAGTRVKASLGSTGRISARWHPRVSQKPEMELLTSVNNLTRVDVRDGQIHTTTALHYEILRGTLSQLRVAVPAGHQVIGVSTSANEKPYTLAEADGRQVLTVEFLSEVEGRVTVEVHTVRDLPEDAFHVAGTDADGAVNGVHALDVVRESGEIAVTHSEELSLVIAEQQGVVRIATSQLNEQVRSDGALGFKFFTPVFTLQATARPVEPRITIDHTAQVVFMEDEIRLTASLNYTVERAGVFQLSLTVPEELAIDDVQCDGMKEFNFDEASRTLLISLAEKRQGQIAVSVTAQRDFQAGVDQSEVVLPLLEPQNTERETGRVYLYSRESIEVVTNEEAVVAAQPLPAPPDWKMENAPLTAAWSFTRRPVTIPVTTKRKAARLSADVATSVNVLPQSAEVVTLLDYRVQFSGLDTFQFQVPEAVSPLIQIEAVRPDPTAPDIMQKTPSDPEDGWVTWTVVMQREVLGTLRLSVTYDLKSEESGADDAEADAADGEEDETESSASDEIVISLFKPLPTPAAEGREEVQLSRLRGEAVVTRDETLSVAASAEGGDVEAIDIRELVLLPQSGTLAFRYFEQPDDAAVQLTLTRTRNAIEEVVATVVRRALIEIVNGKDGMANYRVRMRVKTTERQRLLVDLPVNLELLGVTVAGRDVKLEKATEQSDTENFESYYIPVSRTISVDEEFLIAFQFRWNVAPPPGESEYPRGSMELPLPILGGIGNVRPGGETTVAVQEQRVAVWIPQEFALVGEPSDFVIERQPRLFSSLTNTASQVDESDLNNWIGGGDAGLPLEKKGLVGYVYSNLGGERRIHVVWWNRLKMTLIVSLALVVIAWILRHTTWENKLGILLLVALAAAFAALDDADRAAHIVSAARFGLAFLVGLWLVAGIFGRGGLASLPAFAGAGTPTGKTTEPVVTESARAPAESKPTTSPDPDNKPPESGGQKPDDKDQT